MNDDDIDLSGEDWEAQLTQALARLPAEPTPASLQRRLAAIPREQRAASRWQRLREALPGRWQLAAFSCAVLLVPMALALYLQSQRLSEQQREIAQGRADLALALAYVERANHQARRQLVTTLDRSASRPVADNTIEALQKPLRVPVTTTREYQL